MSFAEALSGPLGSMVNTPSTLIGEVLAARLGRPTGPLIICVAAVARHTRPDRVGYGVR
jgi:hypothetical protein